MNKTMLIFLMSTFIFAMSVANAFAIVDPLSVPNNKFGIHILFPSELEQASKLVNSNGGDWGYVTIPIQAGDRNLRKWQKFMDDARTNHIIPIVRLAESNYYFDTKVWQKPRYEDILDFANFLNSLEWPTKNKYVVIYNEVNRSDEWQGNTNPQEYAQILGFAVDAFKSLDEDFFIIPAGLDNGSINVSQMSINQYDFMHGMDEELPGIFGRIDGMASHSYPNPAFSQPPWVLTNKSVSSFRYERDVAERLGRKNLPVFITETGWSRDNLSDEKISSYMRYAFETVWSDNNIAAVTPFILRASEPYAQFSLIQEDGSYSKTYLTIESMPKMKGEPLLEVEEKNMNTSSRRQDLRVKTFKNENQYDESIVASIDKAKIATDFLKWFFRSLNVL
ncbi:MAG: hypothetical protein HYT07_03215 [Candidatus Levybacteria bacterium]|nr:hypothetical protein [Candidatus Levybacteria bacterium]